jgi:hypothetical protein
MDTCGKDGTQAVTYDAEGQRWQVCAFETGTVVPETFIFDVPQKLTQVMEKHLRQYKIALAGVVVCTLLLYFPSVDFDFLQLDDAGYILLNPIN